MAIRIGQNIIDSKAKKESIRRRASNVLDYRLKQPKGTNKLG
jgi:hypothetical protein